MNKPKQRTIYLIDCGKDVVCWAMKRGIRLKGAMTNDKIGRMQSIDRARRTMQLIDHFRFKNEKEFDKLMNNFEICDKWSKKKRIEFFKSLPDQDKAPSYPIIRLTKKQFLKLSPNENLNVIE